MTKAEKVLLEINNVWLDNWDMIIEVFGEEIANEMDEAIKETALKHNHMARAVC